MGEGKDANIKLGRPDDSSKCAIWEAGVASGGQRAHQVNRMNLGGWWKCGLAGGSAKHFIRNWQSRTLR
jgi:hypothetical protein